MKTNLRFLTRGDVASRVVSWLHHVASFCARSLCGLSLTLFTPGVSGVELAPVSAPDTATAVAWIRFVDGPESYEGQPYHWLGHGDLRLQFEVAPAPNQALELLWGSKNDAREAVVVLNGQTVPMRSGGFNGFRWLRLPIPSGISGSNLLVTFKSSQGRPAFLAEVRLTAPGGDPNHPALTQPAYRAKLIQKPSGPRPQNVEAFPEMRRVWDREPPPPASPLSDARMEASFRLAERNARLANEALYRCRHYVDGWLAHADPVSGLIPRNLDQGRDFWNGRDSAADNYPFMVLTAAITDVPLMEGRLREMLRTEIRLTCRVDRLPDDYSFSKRGWRREQPDLDAIIFDGAEYVKDGLIPVTEWLGPSPWSERMIGITEDLWKHAQVETPFGRIPTLNVEVCGDVLQACARLFWFTGDRKYLDWAIRLGDYFLLGNHHPTRNLDQLRLCDHGCEVINGLTELYVAVHFAAPDKKKAYQEPLHALLDRILEVGRNEDGLLYSTFNPRTGEHSKDLCDTWGYDYDGFYTVYLLDRTETYRDAVRKALGNLKDKYIGAPWGDKSADGYADSIEGALNLFNREPVASAADWIDSQTRLMWGKQQADGIIEGWHGDGNIARTSIMYALWKTAGVTLQPWRSDLRFGAVQTGAVLHLSLQADQPWRGRIVFDRPRHKDYMRLPLDYARINQFPEWFTAQATGRYEVQNLSAGTTMSHTGKELQAGLVVELPEGKEVRLLIGTAH